MKGTVVKICPFDLVVTILLQRISKGEAIILAPATVFTLLSHILAKSLIEGRVNTEFR